MLNTTGLSAQQVNAAATGVGAILDAISDEGLPGDWIDVDALREARSILKALVTEPGDDNGPEVFMVPTELGDPHLFLTRGLAESFVDSLDEEPRIEQQTVCGPTLTRELIRENLDETVTCGTCKGEGVVEDPDGGEMPCPEPACDDGEVPNPELEG